MSTCASSSGAQAARTVSTTRWSNCSPAWMIAASVGHAIECSVTCGSTARTTAPRRRDWRRSSASRAARCAQSVAATVRQVLGRTTPSTSTPRVSIMRLRRWNSAAAVAELQATTSSLARSAASAPRRSPPRSARAPLRSARHRESAACRPGTGSPRGSHTSPGTPSDRRCRVEHADRALARITLTGRARHRADHSRALRSTRSCARWWSPTRSPTPPLSGAASCATRSPPCASCRASRWRCASSRPVRGARAGVGRRLAPGARARRFDVVHAHFGQRLARAGGPCARAGADRGRSDLLHPRTRVLMRGAASADGRDRRGSRSRWPRAARRATRTRRGPPVRGRRAAVSPACARAGARAAGARPRPPLRAPPADPRARRSATTARRPSPTRPARGCWRSAA